MVVFFPTHNDEVLVNDSSFSIIKLFCNCSGAYEVCLAKSNSFWAEASAFCGTDARVDKSVHGESVRTSICAYEEDT